MEQLTIDTGLREYAVNGGPEHGGGVLRFNPSDPNVYSRFCTLQNQLQELDRKSTRLNSSHMPKSRMPSSA